MTATDAPRDRYHAVWIIFFILGLGCILPWHFFTTATMYFISRLEYTAVDDSVGASNRTVVKASDIQNALQFIFSNAMTLTNMVPLLIFSCLNSFIHQRIPQKLRISGSLVVILVVLMLTVVLVKVEVMPETFFWVTLVLMFCAGSAYAFAMGSLFGLAGMFPPPYTAAVTSGHGLAGLVAAISRIWSLGTIPSLRDSALSYFISACVIILLAILSYLALPSMGFFQFYTGSNRPRTSSSSSCQENKSVGPCSLTEEEEKPVVSVVGVVKQIWVFAVSATLNYTITLGVFPAVVVGTKSTIAGKGGVWNTYFIPVSCFLLFNVMDTVGRSLTGICGWPSADHVNVWLPVLVAMRVVFVPLFMLCNVQPRHHLPVVFGHDACYIVFMIVFGFSSGYMNSLCMRFAPRKVARHEAETAGTIMVFFLALGQVLGADISFAFRAII